MVRASAAIAHLLKGLMVFDFRYVLLHTFVVITGYLSCFFYLPN